MKPGILIIGLDAATMGLIEPWAEAGHLPTLRALMSEGARSRLISTPNMHSASAWTSILTGLNPGRHGLFVFSDRDFATGEQVFFKGGDRTGELITSHLARHGLSAGLLNVPMTYPAESVAGGFMVSGLDSPSLNASAFSPADLQGDLFERFPNYAFTPPELGELMREGRIDAALRAWLDLIETQTAAAEYLLETRPVDFFMTVYTASDWGGHNLWKYFADPESDQASDSRRDSLLTIYCALDHALARLLGRANEQTQVYVISDHGMGPHTGASYHLAAWLQQKGYLTRAARGEARASLMSRSRRAAQQFLPAALKEKIKSQIGADRLKRLQAAEKNSFYSSIQWERTAAYTEPGRHVININLEGRNHRGIISRADYDKTCQRIIDDLSDWTDARGNRVVERVARRDEVYHGPFAERASDLYVYWSSEAHLGEPPAEVRARGFWWSGDHRLDGILICKGPGVRREAAIAAATVYDIVPTILHLAGLPVPAGLDGRALDEICDDDFRARNPVKFDSPATSHAADRSSLSASEEELIEDKLRGLGYL